MTKAKGNEVISHRFTSSAFVLSPFAGSPLHFNQIFRSSFFNSEGFLPHSEAPGISFSSRSDVANTAMFVLLQPHWPCFDVIVTILSELSAIMNESRVKYLVIRAPKSTLFGQSCSFGWSGRFHVVHSTKSRDQEIFRTFLSSINIEHSPKYMKKLALITSSSGATNRVAICVTQSLNRLRRFPSQGPFARSRKRDFPNINNDDLLSNAFG